MSELRRWSEEGATPEEERLVSASRRERPDPSARRRALHALGLGPIAIAPHAAPNAGAAASGTALATASTAGVAGGGLGLAIKIVGVGVVVGGISTGAVALRNAHAPTKPAPTVQVTMGPQAAPSPARAEPSQIHAPVATTASASAGVPAEAPSDEASSQPPPEAPPSHAPPSDRSSRVPHPSEAPTSLTQEVSALERAHKLAGRDPDEALRELDRYHARFPGGALSAEETVLRVQALLARGDDAKARALAAAFSAAHPESPYAKRIEDLVRAKKK